MNLGNDIQQQMHQSQLHSVGELMEKRLLDIWHGMDHSAIHDAIDEWRKHLRACMRAKGGHFEQQSVKMPRFRTYVWWKHRYWKKDFDKIKVLRREWKMPREKPQAVQDQSMTMKKSWMTLKDRTNKEHEEWEKPVPHVRGGVPKKAVCDLETGVNWQLRRVTS